MAPFPVHSVPTPGPTEDGKQEFSAHSVSSLDIPVSTQVFQPSQRGYDTGALQPLFSLQNYRFSNSSLLPGPELSLNSSFQFPLPHVLDPPQPSLTVEVSHSPHLGSVSIPSASIAQQSSPQQRSLPTHRAVRRKRRDDDDDDWTPQKSRRKRRRPTRNASGHGHGTKRKPVAVSKNLAPKKSPKVQSSVASIPIVAQEDFQDFLLLGALHLAGSKDVQRDCGKLEKLSKCEAEIPLAGTVLTEEQKLALEYLQKVCGLFISRDGEWDGWVNGRTGH